MGKLARNRTILLSGIEETMSDIDGIVYFDINNYKSALLQELKTLKSLHRKIDSKYQACIKGWSN